MKENPAIDLERFVQAQAPVFELVLTELGSGLKQSHWMWFVFPQITGLGRSTMARRFELHSLTEALAYWAHPVLGPRLAECVQLICRTRNRSAFDILGTPDDLKFRSSMTLFHHATPDEPIFGKALDMFFDGREDSRTLEILARL